MKTFAYSAIVVRSLTKFVCVSVLTGLFACGHVVVVPESELVHINNEPPTVNPRHSKNELVGTGTTNADVTPTSTQSDTINHVLPRTGTSPSDTLNLHVDPQPKKPEQTLD